MSNLKKDIEDLVKKEQLAHCCAGMGCETASRLYADQIINLIESVIGEMEHRETEDMSLKSWTPEDYKAFGRNELRADIKSKLIGGIR